MSDRVRLIGIVWRYPAEREVRTGGRRHRSVVALPIGLIGSIRCRYGGKVRVRATLPPLSHCFWREGMGVSASFSPLSHNCCCQHMCQIYILWRYPAEREVRTGGRGHISVVALPIGLIGSIRCRYGGKVRVRATPSADRGWNGWQTQTWIKN